jgi:CSLREA domain-containing protein
MNIRLTGAFLALIAAARAHALGPTVVVDSTADLHDLSPGDGICSAAPGVCTLRAAVEEANATTDALIRVPAGRGVSRSTSAESRRARHRLFGLFRIKALRRWPGAG